MTTLRIGEVAIISYKSHEKENFIRSICQKIDIKDETLSFGRFEVNDQLALYLYGLSFDYANNLVSMDLVSGKTLGFIIVFDWEDKKAFDATKPLLDYFAKNFNTPILVVANIEHKKSPPIPESFFQPDGIPLSSNSKFIFSQIDDPESARGVMLLFVNMLIEKVS